MWARNLLILAVPAALVACATQPTPPAVPEDSGSLRPKAIGRSVRQEPPRLDPNVPERTASDLIVSASASTPTIGRSCGNPPRTSPAAKPPPKRYARRCARRASRTTAERSSRCMTGGSNA